MCPHDFLLVFPLICVPTPGNAPTGAKGGASARTITKSGIGYDLIHGLAADEGARMEEQELAESAEKARRPEQKQVGITMALVAVLLAITTMLGHRAHTEEVLLQTRTNDQWDYYQAKNNRSEMYAADAKLALLMRAEGQSVATEFIKQAEQQKIGAQEIRQSAERLEEETRIEAKRANYFDLAEVFLEATIVLCSITLLSGSLFYWKVSFVSTAVGVSLATIALIR
jgi:hypothetical protein